VAIAEQGAFRVSRRLRRLREFAVG